MRVVAVFLAAAIATPAIAQASDCEPLTTKIKAQQGEIFRLNVTAASQAVPRSTVSSLDTRLQTLALLTAVQANVQIAIAAKCEVGSIVVDHDPDGANARECGAKIGAAMQPNGNKATLAAAYRLPACGGHFEEQAKAAEAEAVKAAAQAKPPAPKAGGEQDEWRRRVAAYTARREACRETHPDDEAMFTRCVGPIPAPPR